MTRGPIYLILFIVFISLFLRYWLLMLVPLKKCYRVHAKELGSGSEVSEGMHGAADDADEGMGGLDYLLMSTAMRVTTLEVISYLVPTRGQNEVERDHRQV